MRITFRKDNTVQVFRLGKTSNKKISKGSDKIVQSYTFSEDQFNYIADCQNNGTKADFKTFFSLDAKNCFDCPFSMNTGGGGCYTHKVMQYSGFVGMLKSIHKEFGTLESIPEFSVTIFAQILNITRDRYVRFGTYGEPTMHPFELVSSIAVGAKSWTGYTHQYVRNQKFNKFFMASTHNPIQAKKASEIFGFRSFIAVKDNSKVHAVVCPASKESGFKSNCADCGLCSGVVGKGKKDVVIIEH